MKLFPLVPVAPPPFVLNTVDEGAVLFIKVDAEDATARFNFVLFVAPVD